MKIAIITIKNFLYTLGVFCLFMASCKKKGIIPNPPKVAGNSQSLYNLISANFSLQHLDTALILTKIKDTLNHTSNFTVFASPDDTYPVNGNGVFLAFDNYYYQFVQLPNTPLLKRTVNYQIIRGKVSTTDISLAMNKPYATLDGNPIYLSKFIKGLDTTVLINGQTLRYKNIVASNGTYHITSKFIFPTADNNLWDIISGSNLITWNQEQPTEIYNAAGLTKIGATFSNPGLACTLFSIALHRTGLDSLLRGKDPYTVFVPSDTIFGTRFTKSIDSILTTNIDSLKRTLSLYIVPGLHFINDYVLNEYDGINPIAISTLGNDSLYIKPNFIANNLVNVKVYGFGNRRIRNFPILKKYEQDIACSNGVIHFIGGYKLLYNNALK